ncbi:factor-independent urate hydroxylase [Cohnella faecalis]|uniref:factor-independent urate hydroxylase n=1 Tax=Cohnella faecalis TaxID=2315694 RepID=UPI00361E537D
MMKLANGRTLYYGKGDVLCYRTYAAPLEVASVPESSCTGDGNVIFAHNIKFAVSGESLLTSFTEGDNSRVVATDSMKNFILQISAQYEGSTTEGLLAFAAGKFLEKYEHITGIELSADRLPFDPVKVGEGESGVVYRPSRGDYASASLAFERTPQGAKLTDMESGVSELHLIKVSGSSFYGFVRDEYTTLPDSYDRPLFIYLNIHWRYGDAEAGLDGSIGRYVSAAQVRDIATSVFHENNTPSIQYLIYLIGLRLLERFPQLAEVRFESNNRTWETIVEPAGVGTAGVFTEPRPPYGFQGFTMTQADLEEEAALRTAAAGAEASGKLG